MKIGLDIMGGDFAPKATVLGAIAACELLSDHQKIVLIGDKEVALSILDENNFSPDRFEFVHTTEVIGMGEHPTKAVVQKPDSSISVGFKLLKEWAYAGLFFTMTGAVISHIASNDIHAQIIAPIVFSIFTVLSWYLRPASRKIILVN